VSTPGPRPIRIGNDEREAAVRALGEHFAQGRLDPEEYEERASAGYAARTADDLDRLFDDLPRPAAPHATVQRPVAAPIAVPPAATPDAPYGRDPATGLPYSDRHQVLAGVLQLLLPFGIGRFYTGHTGIALAQLLLVFVGVGVVWSFIDGIVLLVGRPTDRYGRPLRP
jgi:hypothetical protein